jgi:signal transduction histidine kinase
LAVTLLYFTRRQQKINSELSSAKKKIEEHNKQLEHTVDERTKDLNQSNLTLQHVNEELDYFIYKSSHDLRGPLVTLKGLCNIAFIDLNEPLAIEYFKKFDVTIDKLSVILMRLQMVRNVANSQLNPVSIHFKKIIDEIISFEKKKGVPEDFLFSCEIQPECTIVSDEGLVKIIFENLIDNAVKYRAPHISEASFVKLTLTREKDWVKAIVEDNGIGIHPNEINNIFKMFVRGSEQSEIGGVGLYLVKASVDKIGGEISIVQSGSNGTTFQVLFPVEFNEATLI